MTCILENSFLAAVPVYIGGGRTGDGQNSYEFVTIIQNQIMKSRSGGKWG